MKNTTMHGENRNFRNAMFWIKTCKVFQIIDKNPQ